MNRIIEQISAIDAAAFENEQKNIALLNNEKNKYENEISKYLSEKVLETEVEAKSIYDGIMSKAKSELALLAEKNKKRIDCINENFSKVENKLIEEIFAELFEAEAL